MGELLQWSLRGKCHGRGARASPSDDFPGYGEATLGDDRLYTVGLYLYALDPATGDQLWRLDLGEQPFAPVYADGVVYVGTRQLLDGGALGAGHAVAVDAATGEVLWRHPIPDAPAPETWLGGVTGPGALTSELLIVAGKNARVYGIDRVSGETRWVHHCDSPFGAGVALVEGVAVVGNSGGNIEGVRAETGKGLWKSHVGTSVFAVVEAGPLAMINNFDTWLVDSEGQKRTLPAPSLGDHDTSARLHDGVVYVGARQAFAALHLEPQT